MRNRRQKPDERVAENHTVTCHENDIDIFKSAGLASKLNISKQSDKPVMSPGGGSSQGIRSGSDLKENTSGNVLGHRQIQKTVLPCPQNTSKTLQANPTSGIQSPNTLNLSNVSRSALSRNSNTTMVSVSNSLCRTPQNAPNLRMSTTVRHQIPGTPRTNLSSTTHQQASVRAIAPTLSKTVVSQTPNTVKISRNFLTPRSSVPGSGGFSRTRNVHNISPMDLLIDLTKPKSNSVRTTLGNPSQSLQLLMTPQQSNVVPRVLTPRSAITSRVNTVRTARTTPIPLAPKPAPYTPVTYAQQLSGQTSNFKRPIPKIVAPSKAKTTPPTQLSTTKTTATTSLIFHSTEFVPKGNTVVQLRTKTSQSIPYSSSNQVKSRPTYVAQNHLQGTPPRPSVPVTTKVVQLSNVGTQPSFKQVPSSKIVTLSTNPSQPILNPNQITSKIIELNPDPAQLAANFLRLRAKASQGGPKTIPLVTPQSNSAHPRTPSPVLPISIATSTPTQRTSKLDSSLPISTTPKVSPSNTCSVTQTKAVSQNVSSVAAVKGSSDSDGMAVVVGSPEQITKLLSENPNMIELLGSKSTDYLGKLLTSHSKQESCVRQFCKKTTTTTGGQQNQCESIKEALKRPNPRMIDLTKATSKHVIDLTKDEKNCLKSSGPKNLQLVSTRPSSSLTASTPSSTITPSNQSLTLTSSNRPSIPTTSVQTNKIDLTKCRNAVRKLDRSCLNANFAAKNPKQGTVAVSLGKPVQPSVKSPTLDLHSSAHTLTNAKSNPQYIFHNRRFLHASLDTPSLGKKANRVSPLSSPAKIMAHVEDQSKNLKPVVSESKEGVEYYQKLQAQQKERDKTLNNRDTSSISKKDIVKSRGKRTYTKRTYTRRKGLDKDANNKTKKNDEPVSTKRKSVENCLQTVKKTKIAEDDIVLPDFARVKQSDLRSKRLEKVNQELNVMFSITSEEGLEVKARTCEGTFNLLSSTIGLFNVFS